MKIGAPHFSRLMDLSFEEPRLSRNRIHGSAKKNPTINTSTPISRIC